MRTVSRPAGLILCSCFFFSAAPSFAADTAEKFSPGFSEEIEGILSRRTSELQDFLRNPEILDVVRAANFEHKNMTLNEILGLDKKFRATKDADPWIRGFMTNACAQHLIRYQKDHPGYAELFITDAKGLNVGQTNRTSDYYQADEDWWLRAYENGAGKAYHGDIEFDESSQSQAVSIYAPIMDGDPSKAIGVAKAVLDIAQIKEEL